MRRGCAAFAAAAIGFLTCAGTAGAVPPEASPDHYVGVQYAELRVEAPGVLGNDPGGDSLEAVLVSSPDAAVSLSSDGGFFIVPETAGELTFAYRTRNTEGELSDAATVTLEVAANARPVVPGRTFRLAPGARVYFTFDELIAGASDPDGEPVAITGYGSPEHGTMSYDPGRGQWVYEPAAGFTGTDEFRLAVADPHGATSAAIVQFIVGEPDPADPVAVDDQFTGYRYGVLRGNVLANDQDPSGNGLTAELIGSGSGPGFSSVDLQSDGRFDFYADAVGTHSFVYRAIDAGDPAHRAEATATVEVLPNSPPVAVDDERTTTAGVPLVIDMATLTANDTDPDGDDVSPGGWFSLCDHGELQQIPGATNHARYVPAAGMSGVDVCTYYVDDVHGAKSVGVLRVSVSAGLPLTVTVEQDAGTHDPTNQPVISFRVAFSEDVRGFDAPSDVTIEGTQPHGDAQIDGSGRLYTVSVPLTVPDPNDPQYPSGERSVIVSVPAGAAESVATGAPNAASTSTDNAVTTDLVRPTMFIIRENPSGTATYDGPIRFRVSLSEPIKLLDAGGFTLGGTAQPAALTISPPFSGDYHQVYDLDVTGMRQTGTVTVQLNENYIWHGFDRAGNHPIAFTLGQPALFDGEPPQVVVSRAGGQAASTAGGPIRFTAVFDKAVSGLEPSEIEVGGTAAPDPGRTTVSGGPFQFEITVDGTTGPGTVTARVPAGVAQTSAGIANDASTAGDDGVLVTVPLGVTIDQAADQADPTNALPIRFDVVFTEPVTGFDATDLSFTGSTAGPFGATVAPVAGDPVRYTVSVPTTASNGTVVASIPAGRVLGGDGTANTASTSTDDSVTLDRSRPTVTIAPQGTSPFAFTSGPIRYTVQFSKPIVGFAADDVTFRGHAAVPGVAVTDVIATPGDASRYVVEVGGMGRDGQLIADVRDRAARDSLGNESTASPNSGNIAVWDAAGAPTVTVEAFTADPTRVVGFGYRLTFSEPVQRQFHPGDVIVGGTACAAGGCRPQQAGAQGGESVTIDQLPGGPAITDGTVVVGYAAGGAVDPAGNPSRASTSADNTITYDTTRPTVTLEQAPDQADPTDGREISWVATFSEDVTGVTPSTIRFTPDAVMETPVMTGSGREYRFTAKVRPEVAQTTVTARIDANAAQDAVQNLSTAATSRDATVTFRPEPRPRVTISQGAAQADPTDRRPVVFDITVSEPVIDFVAADVTIDGTAGATAATLDPVPGDPLRYTATVANVPRDGTVTASIAENVMTDLDGFGNLAATTTDASVDFTGQLKVSVEQAGTEDPTSAAEVAFTATFSRPPTGFTADDVEIGGTAGATEALVSGSGTDWTITLRGMTRDGTVIASIPEGTLTDDEGFGNRASTSVDNEVTYAPVTNRPPVVTITTPADGAVYALRQQVAADYDCTDPDGREDVASCTGGVPNGQPLATGTAGLFPFVVTATDRAGVTTQVTRHFRVATGAAPVLSATTLAGAPLTSPGGLPLRADGTATFRIRNGGGFDLAITQVGGLGGCTATARRTLPAYIPSGLVAGNTLDVDVRCTDPASLEKTIIVRSNDPLADPFTLIPTGTGAPARIQLASVTINGSLPNPISGNALALRANGTATVRVTNSGGYDLALTTATGAGTCTATPRRALPAYIPSGRVSNNTLDIDVRCADPTDPANAMVLRSNDAAHDPLTLRLR